MKILFLTIGDKTVASTRVRVHGYLPILKQKGIEYKILSFTSRYKCRRILNLKGDTLFQSFLEIWYKIIILIQLLVLSRAYNIIFIQKVILYKPIWNILRRLNKRIIFDFDDAIHLCKDIKYLLKEAASVIVSNDILQEFASEYNRNVYKLISPVEIDNQNLPKNKNFVTLGWIGSPAASKSLNLLLSVFKNLIEKFNNLNIIFMGAHANRHFESLRINTKDWSLENEEKFLEEIDIGIMPLEDNEWSRAKAGYKILLYMSRSVPCVASPVGINKEIIKDGVNGYWAETTKMWIEKLSLLIENPALRKKLGEEGRRTAEERYAYTIMAPRLMEIIKNTTG